ncbi:hypothetical protein OXU80_22635 [Jeongeupella avenae]|uniref:Uncharacterized protein n=1 Tax=Antarcticirhabdus aurantiaca TaxID=2606717 RepID=A0ACD4NL94_9HYPH|nr:hypothetical protein [Antarcticirhabdus aurantiaca]WAJ27609.1 hypothetical protein OXU80_22635 [Jeongeuplla avenae]
MGVAGFDLSEALEWLTRRIGQAALAPENGIAAGFEAGQAVGDFVEPAEDRPSIQRRHDQDRDGLSRQGALERHVAILRDKDRKACLHGSINEIAIRQALPFVGKGMCVDAAVPKKAA